MAAYKTPLTTNLCAIYVGYVLPRFLFFQPLTQAMALPTV
jgi:hypothetical protein